MIWFICEEPRQPKGHSKNNAHPFDWMKSPLILFYILGVASLLIIHEFFTTNFPFEAPIHNDKSSWHLIVYETKVYLIWEASKGEKNRISQLRIPGVAHSGRTVHRETIFCPCCDDSHLLPLSCLINFSFWDWSHLLPQTRAVSSISSLNPLAITSLAWARLHA